MSTMNQVLIGGHPATPELWASWDEAIGIGPKAKARTRAAHAHITELAKTLKAQAEACELAHFTH